jgi:hypothetical protein
MNQEMQSAAAALRRELGEKVAAIKNDPQMAEVMEMVRVLNGLEGLIQQSKTTLAQVFALEDGTATAAITPTVAPDEFVHIAALEAAKRYLRKVGKPAREFREIVTAIKAGGGEVRDEAALRNSLIRSTADIKKVSDSLFGLLEWYPARRGRPPGSKSTNGQNDAQDDGEQQQTQDAEENASPDTNE